MASIEKLTLSGALTLLTYVQHSRLEEKRLDAKAVTAVLCEMLSQISIEKPGITKEYGWQKVPQQSEGPCS
ncbi:MAG: hypothetical protein KME16_16365 [Scytolyngbya sp. HA4215-MV1]|jgi:hypothetical protein|nr:hypothetical protein [Scytolyngbya sp. HA4215-MV1]